MANHQADNPPTRRILILGCGYVSFPCIKYLAQRPENSIVISAKTWVNLGKASKKFFNNQNVRLYSSDVCDTEDLNFLVSQSDLVISLVPYTFHPLVYEAALKHKKHVVTTSYISEKMLAYDGPAKSSNLTFFNEVGVDPGVDHIYAMKVLHDVKQKNGKVECFKSYCGGLPKVEYSYDNPLRYKFSWSSQGVLLALKNNARFISGGKVVEAQAEELMDQCKTFDIDSGGTHYSLIGYPNRDSSIYLERYNIIGANEVIRGTLRFPEFKNYVIFFHKLDLLNTNPAALAALKSSVPQATILTWTSLISKKLKSKSTSTPDIVSAVKGLSFLKSDKEVEDFVKGLSFLGLLSDHEVAGADTILGCMAKEIETKLQYGKNEADVVALVHEFVVSYPGSSKPAKDKIICSAVWVGENSVDTAMAKLVGVTCGITAQLILDGKINTRGVLAPVTWELASPIYDELLKEDIVMDEITVPL